MNFPILRDWRERQSSALIQSIPWALIAPHEAQAKSNHGDQTLKTLADRGGLSPGEAVAVIEDRRWRMMSDAEAEARLESLVAAFARRRWPDHL